MLYNVKKYGITSKANMDSYYSNKPINCAEDDLYNRTSFAEDVVQMLSSLKNNENYIVGIYAKWGFGKTSAINLIGKKLNGDKEFVFVDIDAWSLGGQSEKILWQILKEVYEKLTGKTVEKKIGKFGKWLRNLSAAKLPFDIDYELDMNHGGRKETKISSGRILNSMGFIGSLMESSNNIAAAKNKMDKAIQASNKKVVVFIDNIDRLDKSQVVEIFRLLSTIADYAGITYILPFDKDYVCSAIEENLPPNQSGPEYIEKIIQIPIHLPMLSRNTLDRAFTILLTELFEEYSIKVSREEIGRFQSLYYYHGINKYLQSPRNINQIINALRFMLPMKLGEVNVIDLIILEIIRVFDEPFYERIRDSRNMLVQNKNSLSDGYAFDDEHKERKSDIEKVFDVNSLKIIKQLFPFVSEIYNSAGVENYDSLRKAQRLGSEYYFDRFFGSLDEINDVSDQKILQLLNDSEDKQAIEKNMVDINSQNIDIALRIISDRCNLIKNKLAFCESLLDLVNNEGLTQSRSVPLMISAFDRVLFTIDIILENSSDKLSDYSALLKYNFVKGRIHTVPYLIRQVVLYSDPNNTHKAVVLGQEDLEQYKATALSIIREIAKSDKMPLNTTEDYAFLYSYWADFGNKNEISDYVKKHITTADMAIDFMSQFLSKWSGMGDSVYYRGDFDRETYQKVCRYIEPEYFYTLIIQDKKYGQYKGIAKDTIISFEDHWDEDAKAIAEVGNEHSDGFRKVVAQRFIYMFENLDEESQMASK